MNIRQYLANPVLTKEFRVRMRSNKTPWIISLYLVTLALVVFFIMYEELSSSYTYSQSNFRDIFIILSMLQYGLIIFATPGLTAGVISGERERQTLSVLLTTNLSSFQIITGKWLSALSFMLLLVFTSLPLYGIVLLFGGVAFIQILKIFGIYLITILSIGALGVCVSALTKRTGVAAVITYSLVFAYTALLNLIGILLLKSMEEDMARVAGFEDAAAALTTHPWYGLLRFIDTINPVSIVLRVFANQTWWFGSGGANFAAVYNSYAGFFAWYFVISVLMLVLATKFLRRRYAK